MIKFYIYCLVLIIGNVEVGSNIGMTFHQEVMEIVSYDNYMYFLVEKGDGTIREGAQLRDNTVSNLNYFNRNYQVEYTIVKTARLSNGY